MDPDTTRTTLIELANTTLGLVGQASTPPTDAELIGIAEKAEQLAEAAHDLDEWLRMGGALPAAWSTMANGRVRG